MRSLRKTLTSLSPAILLVPVLCGIISGQSGLTTIQDTLFDADGARYNGTLTIQWSTFDTTNPGTIIQQSKTVQVTNGNLLVQLAANNTATPPANLYTVLYQSDGDQQYTETWSVPFSATPLKVTQVRIGTGSGPGSSSGLTGGGATTESGITNLVSDLNARPIKGPGFGTNAVAVVDQNGQIETVAGNAGDCVFVDGTTGPCSSVVLPTFVTAEVPSGTIDGNNSVFTLVNAPSGTSLLLFRNGLLLQPGTGLLAERIDNSVYGYGNTAAAGCAGGCIPARFRPWEQRHQQRWFESGLWCVRPERMRCSGRLYEGRGLYDTDIRQRVSVDSDFERGVHSSGIHPGARLVRGAAEHQRRRHYGGKQRTGNRWRERRVYAEYCQRDIDDLGWFRLLDIRRKRH